MTGYATSLGASDEHSITVLGQNLAEDLMGKVGFGELAFWLVALRRPRAGELRLFEAVLVALAEHGLTPSVIATRLTLTGAPESVQGAMAAGLLGGGSRFLGVTEDAGRFLSAFVQGRDVPTSPEGWDELALEAVRAQRAAGRFVPGLGHNVHRSGDPRTPRLFALAEQEGVFGPHLELFRAIGRVHPQVLGRTLPLNGAGACGAVLCDLGFGVDTLRGFALLARCAGLVGHVAEEMRRPIGFQVYENVDGATSYDPPAAPTR
jgi:citrate synthase